MGRFLLVVVLPRVFLLLTMLPCIVPCLAMVREPLQKVSNQDLATERGGLESDHVLYTVAVFTLHHLHILTVTVAVFTLYHPHILTVTGVE